MNDLQQGQDTLERVAATYGRYAGPAYAFVLAALEQHQLRQPVRGHISGSELAHACRHFALEQFGLTARTVLAHWGVERTQDFGQVVYHLIDEGLLVSHPQDRLEDFDDVFDFAEVFDRGYPWVGVQRNGNGNGP